MTRLAVILAGLTLSLLPASPAAAARSEFFGIAQGRGLDVKDLRRMADSRVRTDRFLFQWRRVKPSQGTFNWGPTDRFVGGLASHGIRAGSLRVGIPAVGAPGPFAPPGRQRVRRVGMAELPQGGGGALRAGRQLLGHGYHQQYGAGATPLPIQSWQIWNEPNLQKYFDPGGTSVQGINKYAQLVKISHDAIKSQDPDALIVLAGIPGYPAAEGLNAWDFLSGLYEVPGFKDHFDVAALHPYTGHLDGFRRQILEFRAAMTNHGDRARRLDHRVRLGIGTPGPLRHQQGPRGSSGDALRLLRDDPEAPKRLERAAPLLVPLARSAAGPVGAGWCSFCASAGLLSYNRTAKPAYSRFRSFATETTPPSASITAGPSQGGFTNDPTPSFSFGSNEPGSTFVCRFDAAPTSPVAPPTRSRSFPTAPTPSS